MANGNNNQGGLSGEEFAAQRKINQLKQSSNDISRTYGTLLSAQLEKEGKITKTLKSRIDLASTLNNIKKSSTDGDEKSKQINDQILKIEKKQLENNKKYFGKNRQIAVQKNKQLETDKKMLKVERDKAAAMKSATDLQKMSAAKMAGAMDKFFGMFERMPGGDLFLESVGLGQKTRQQFKNNLLEFTQGGRKFGEVFQTSAKSGKGLTKSMTGAKVSMKAMVGAGAILVATIGIAVGLFMIMKKIAVSFAKVTDKLGKAFGVMGTDLQDGVVKSLRSSRSEAIALGFGIEDLISVTSTLSSEFGIGFQHAADTSLAILDSSKAMGLTVDEGAKLFGTLMKIGGLTQSQAEHLAESTYQLARQNDVNPVAVMQDMANSAEVIAKFGAQNLSSISKAAIQAKKMGVGLSDVESIADNLLDFQSSLNNEIEASIMLGKNLNLQKARELALTGDLSGMMDTITSQLGGINAFNDLDVLQKISLAKALGVSVSTMEKLSKAQDTNINQSQSFVDLLGKDGMSNLTAMFNELKKLGAVFIEKAGPAVERIVDKLTDFMNDGGIDMLVSAAENLASIMISIVENITAVSTIMGMLGGAAAGFMVGGPKGAILGMIGGGIGGYGLGQSLQPDSSPGTMKQSSVKINVKDFKSAGGSHLVVTPMGKVLQTNPKDTVFGSTKVNDFASGPEGSLSVNGGGNNAELVNIMNRLIEKVEAHTNVTRKMRDQNESLIGETRRIGSKTAAAIEGMN